MIDTALEVRTNGVVVGGSLVALAERARTEHTAVESAMGQVIGHAIAAGEALAAARAELGSNWDDWVVDVAGISTWTGRQYVRLWTYREVIGELPPGTSYRRAITYLRGLPAVDQGERRRGVDPYPQSVRDEAKALRNAGVAYSEIAETLGIRSSETVRRWLSASFHRKVEGEKVKRNRQRLRERRALERERVAAEVKAKGGELAVAYALIRKAAQALDRAEHTEHSARLLIQQAMAHLYQSEDCIADALRGTNYANPSHPRSPSTSVKAVA